tara:strand:- start:9020 stop:9484 length:465 start_codon:yes stop_codon:yes gene_type:complete
MKVRFDQFDDSQKNELSEMIKSLYSEDSNGEPINDQKIEKTISYFWKYPQHGKIVIFSFNGLTIGYSILINYWSNEYGGCLLQIDELYIRKNFRSHGIGTAFIQYLTNNYKETSKAVLLEVSPSNKMAYKFYIKNGFTEVENQSMRYTFSNGNL